jgi:hypothetical protein
MRKKLLIKWPTLLALRPRLTGQALPTKNGDARSVSGPTASWITFDSNERLFPSPCEPLWSFPWPAREGHPLLQLSCQRVVDSHTFQLAVVTPLYVDIKVHAESCVQAFLHGWPITRAVFCWRHLWDGAQHMLSKISWKVSPIAPSSLVTYLLRLMPPQSAISNRCQPSPKGKVRYTVPSFRRCHANPSRLNCLATAQSW